MKVFTFKFDTATPTPNKFWVAPHSQFAIGIKVLAKGQETGGTVSLTKDGQTVTAEQSKVDGFTIFNVTSGSTGPVEYTVTDSAKPTQPLKLMQITTDSTVFEIDKTGGGGTGGGLQASQVNLSYDENTHIIYLSAADHVTSVNAADFIKDGMLSTATYDSETKQIVLGFNTDSGLDNISVDVSDLVDTYTAGTGLTCVDNEFSLTAAIPTKTSELTNDSNFLTAHQSLADYYTKSETSSAAEINTALAGKQPAGNYLPLSGGTLTGELQIAHEQLRVYDNLHHMFVKPDGLSLTDETEQTSYDYTMPLSSGTLALTSQIPTVNDATITLTQGGTTKGSFTLNLAADMSVELDAGGAGGGSVYVVSSDTLLCTELSVIKMNETEYANLLLSGDEKDNALYVVDSAYANAFGSAIKNVGEPTLSTDAATKNYVDTATAGLVTNLSGVAGIMKISQADYDVLSTGGTLDTDTLYVII